LKLRLGRESKVLKFGVATVAENGIGGMLTTAEVDGFRFGGLEFYGRELAALVAAVAEGLPGAPAAGAPVIALAGFDSDGIRTLLGNRRFWHGELSSKGNISIIAEIRERPRNSRENHCNHWFGCGVEWQEFDDLMKKTSNPPTASDSLSHSLLFTELQQL
jgi:hypothetical protein